MSLSKPKFRDVREAIRVKSRIPLRYHKVHEGKIDEAFKESVTKDISINGILFEAPEMIPLGQRLKVFLNMPGIEHIVGILGKVARLEEIHFGHTYDIGLKFEQIDGADRQRIKRLIEMVDIIHLLNLAHSERASDLHLTYGRPPILRVCGHLIPLDMEALFKDDLKAMIYSILNEEQIKRFEKHKELDFAFSPDPEKRFRVNVHMQRGNVEATFRTIMPRIRTIEELGLPNVVADLALKRKGIVIISGPTGAGKTTTLAAMVDLINSERESVVICLEDPIEYVHQNKKSIIKQREIGTDTASFSTALKEALRQDPDVILIGELQDAESVQTAITAAETGHLVLTSMHAPNSIQVIDRITSMFTAQHRKQVSIELSNCLQGIISQALLPRNDGSDRVVATEALIISEAVKSIIREGNTMQLISSIQTGGRYKMHTMRDSVLKLYRDGIINQEVAAEYCNDLDLTRIISYT
ncbi:MAG: PilT/PilU family type 4a pilus ATPase [bacterium]